MATLITMPTTSHRLMVPAPVLIYLFFIFYLIYTVRMCIDRGRDRGYLYIIIFILSQTPATLNYPFYWTFRNVFASSQSMRQIHDRVEEERTVWHHDFPYYLNLSPPLSASACLPHLAVALLHHCIVTLSLSLIPTLTTSPISHRSLVESSPIPWLTVQVFHDRSVLGSFLDNHDNPRFLNLKK